METPRQTLERIAETLRNMDFRVFLSSNKENAYGYYSDEKNVAYIQVNEFRPGFNVAICNATPGSHGRHLIIEPDNSPVPEEALTREYLRRGFALYPSFFTPDDRKMMPVRKYLNLDEFLKEYDKELVEIW